MIDAHRARNIAAISNRALFWEIELLASDVFEYVGCCISVGCVVGI